MDRDPSAPAPDEAETSPHSAAPPDIATPAEPRKHRFQLDRSDIIALIALLISVLGTVLAYRETNILTDQQELAQDQKAAGVWPYIDPSRGFRQVKDTVWISFTITNKGVGPASVSGVSFLYGANPVARLEAIAAAISEEYENLGVSISFATEGFDEILAPGESSKLYEYRLQAPALVTEQALEVFDRLDAHYCYCSVYGDCWERAKDDSRPVKTTDCAARLEL